MAEVALERVAVDHDPVLPALPRDAVAEVLAVGALLGAELGDDHGDRLQHSLEFLRQGVDRVGDQLRERVGLRFRAASPNGRVAASPERWGRPQTPRGGPDERRATGQKTSKLRRAGLALAVAGVLAGGVVVSGCGNNDGTTGGTVTGNAQEQAEQGVEKAEKGIEEGKEKAEKGIEEAKEEFEDSKGSAKESRRRSQEGRKGSKKARRRSKKAEAKRGEEARL